MVARLVIATYERRPRAQAIRVLPPESEASFMLRVLECAQVFGWQRRYHTFDSRKSQPGFPDLVLVRAPRVLFIELKADTAPRQLPMDQALWRAELEQCPGVEYRCWRPRDWPEVVKTLRWRAA